jgi:hypothetical protein
MAIRVSLPTGLFELGRYHKAPIYLHSAFFITAAALAWPFWRMLSLRGLALGMLFIAMVFTSILAHELAHAEIARRYRMAARRIDIHMLGGLVQFCRRRLPAGRVLPSRRLDRCQISRSDFAIAAERARNGRISHPAPCSGEKFRSR